MSLQSKQPSSDSATSGQEPAAIEQEVADWLSVHLDLIAATQQAHYNLGKQHDNPHTLQQAITANAAEAVMRSLRELSFLVASHGRNR